jgi:hypothetical protein
MLYEKEEPPITFMDGNALKEGLKSFYILKLSIGKSYYQRDIWLKLCDQVLKSLLKTCSHLCQDSQLNHSHLFAALVGAAVPHLERGSAAPRHYRTLVTVGKQGTFILFPCLLQHLSFFPNSSLDSE